MTDQDVLNEIQIHLLEEPNFGVLFSSDLWEADQVIAHLNSSYRDFISNTRTNLEITTIPTVVGQSRYDLADFTPDILDISRLAFDKSPTIGHLYFDLT